MVSEASRHVTMQSFAAVRELALGTGSLQERLEGACDALLTLESRETPDTLREEFQALLADIMRIDDLATLSDEAAVAIAARMLAFHERLLLHP